MSGVTSSAFPMRIGRTDVYVVPTTHWHPAGAIDVLRCLYSVRPQLVLLELPEGTEKLVESGLKELLPTALGFAIVLSYVTSGEQDQSEALVLSATDSLTHAAWWSIRHTVPWRGIDLPVPSRMDHHAQDTSLLPDPWWAIEEPDVYRAALWQALHGQCLSLGDAARDEHMAARICQTAASVEGPIVVVVGAAHLVGVQRWLTGERRATPQNPTPLTKEPHLARIGGVGLLAGHLGPLPGLASALLAAAQDMAAVQSFCPREHVERLVSEAQQDYQHLTCRLPGIGQLQRFWRLAEKPVVTKARYVPGAVELIRAAAGAVNADFALAVAHRCLGDWQQEAACQHPVVHLQTPQGNSLDVGTTNEVWIKVRDTNPAVRDNAMQELSNWAQKLSRIPESGLPERFPDPANLPKRRLASCLTDECWQHGLEMIRLARQLATGFSVRPALWNGGRLGQLDTHEMIRAAVRGRRRIYCQVVDRRKRSCEDERDEFHPIVWVFEDEPGRDYWPTTFFTRLGPHHIYYNGPVLLRTDRCTKHIRYLAALATLSPWWYMRNEPDHYCLLPWWIETRGYKVPREDPWSWPVGSTVARPYEHLVLAALRCARQQVILVSDTGHRATDALRAAADALKISLIEIELSRFPPDAVKRFQCFEFRRRWVQDPY
jgi:hypothetical protein